VSTFLTEHQQLAHLGYTCLFLLENRGQKTN